MPTSNTFSERECCNFMLFYLCAEVMKDSTPAIMCVEGM